jgi:hypothetical protein
MLMRKGIYFVVIVLFALLSTATYPCEGVIRLKERNYSLLITVNVLLGAVFPYWYLELRVTEPTALSGILLVVLVIIDLLLILLPKERRENLRNRNYWLFAIVIPIVFGFFLLLVWGGTIAL